MVNFLAVDEGTSSPRVQKWRNREQLSVIVDGTEVASHFPMDTATFDAPSAAQGDEGLGMSRWTFIRGTRSVTCAIRARGLHRYDISVVPRWDRAASIVESYDGAAAALKRHEQIVREFRHAGWKVLRNAPDENDAVARPRLH